MLEVSDISTFVTKNTIQPSHTLPDGVGVVVSIRENDNVELILTNDQRFKLIVVELDKGAE